MDRSKFKSPTKEALREGFNNRGKYPDSDSRRYIFTPTGNSLVWKVDDRSHKVRLLPIHPEDNINFYGMLVHIHTNVGVSGDQFLCLKKMKNQACPICEQQAELWETEPDMAKSLYPTPRYLVWMVDLSIPKDKQRAQVWSCPRTAMDDVLGVSYKKATDEILNLADLDDGIAIYFDREKKQGSTFSQYKNFQLDDSPTPVKEEWVDGIISFSEVIEYASYDEVKNAFFGLEDTEKIKEPSTPVQKVVETTVPEEYTPPANVTIDLDNMDRDELEILASTVLLNDYEESEIEEMGTKKLKRLVKEALERKQVVEEPVKEIVVDPKQALKDKLRERIGK